MRRIAAKYARPGMVIGRRVYDSAGNLMFDQNDILGKDCSMLMTIHGVKEVLVEDFRVADVPVQPLIAPELEAEAAQTLHQLLTESAGSATIDDTLLEQVEKPIYAMTRDLFRDVVGEINAAGCFSPDDFVNFRPVKVAGASLLMGRKAGLRMIELASLGLAALLMDVGYVCAPGLQVKPGPLTEQEKELVRTHPDVGARLLERYQRFSAEVGKTVRHHHERLDGSGYPAGLRGDAISTPARILAITDSYYELVSERPGQHALLPHQAIEFIMAYSGELFDPGLVQLFSRTVPLYPAGTTVKLSTGEVGIISNGNPGHIGRPVVRICSDSAHIPLTNPFDIDLSRAEFQDRLIVEAMEY